MPQKDRDYFRNWEDGNHYAGCRSCGGSGTRGLGGLADCAECDGVGRHHMVIKNEAGFEIEIGQEVEAGPWYGTLKSPNGRTLFSMGDFWTAAALAMLLVDEAYEMGIDFPVERY